MIGSVVTTLTFVSASHSTGVDILYSTEDPEHRQRCLDGLRMAGAGEVVRSAE